MINNELKKKNYFRYIQLSNIKNNLSNEKLSLLFILENEIFKIFYSTEEHLLRKIKYQWFIEEIKKKESNFSLAKNIKQIFNPSVKKKLILIIEYFRDMENEFDKHESIILFFKKINIIYRDIIKIIGNEELKLCFFFQLIYFCYVRNSNSKNYFFIEFFSMYDSLNVKELDNHEKTFVEIFFSKIKKKKKILKIGKLEFLFRLIYNMILK